jgi:hypothetical protein
MTLILSGSDGLSDVDGSAATPAIRGTDANTGIFFPAADTIAFSEGGVEAARFDSAGNFGLGVTPSAWGSNARVLQIAGTGALFGQTNANIVSVTANTYWDNTNFKYINSDFANRYVQYQGQHIWLNAPSGTAGNNISFTQAMTLNASGNLGIGNTTPSFRLDVVSSSNPTIRVDDGVGSGTRIAGRLLLGANSTLGVAIENSVVGFDDVCSMVFKTTAAAGSLTERMRLDASGNLGVGTSSPAVKLDVVGAISATDTISTSKNTNAAFISYLATNANAGSSTEAQFKASNGTDTGVFGIMGTGASTYGARLAGDTFIYSGINTASKGITIMADTGTGVIKFAAGGNTERARIDSSGLLLVGLTSSLNAEATVQLGGFANTRLVIDSSSTQGIFFTKAGVDNGTFRVSSGGNYEWYLKGSGSSNMTLSPNGLGLSTSIYPAAFASYTISTNSWSANTFYQIIAPGVLGNYTTYWVTVRWDHGGGGGPFIMATAFMFSVVNTNGGGSDNTFTPLTSSHTGGGGTLSFRSKADFGSTTGLEAASTSIVGGTMYINIYRFV